MNPGTEPDPMPASPSTLPVPLAADTTPDAAADATLPVRTCPNCGAAIHGPYCYACGQSEKGMIRHLSEVLSDLADIVFNVDSRIFRSLWDLYLRPGFLTTEYLAGRRARYVTPFRLFFFLCVIAFFAVQLTFDVDDASKIVRLDPRGSTGAGAQDAAEIDRRAEVALAALGATEAITPTSTTAHARLESKRAKILAEAEQRKAKLAAPPAAADPPAAASADAEDAPAADKPDLDVSMFNVGGKAWDAQTNPLRIGWLPESLNKRFNQTLEHMRDNLRTAPSNPGRLVAGLFSVLPQTLFVLMPLFAVLLKLVYLFKRRLYMEHLLVALHSHAFIFLSLLLLAVLALAREAASPVPALRAVLGWLIAAVWIWLPLYLLLMQRRVYRQNWFVTLLKFNVVGLCYLIMVSFGLVGAVLASLAIT